MKDVNVVEFRVSDIPVYGTVEARVYKRATDKDPKVTIYNYPELQDENVKADMNKLLSILENRSAFSDAVYDGADLVFNVDANRDAKDVSSVFSDAIVRFKDYNSYRKRVDDMERQMNMPVSEFTTEKNKIGTVPTYEEFFITLRKFITVIETSKTKIDLNHKVYEEKERAKKEEKSRNGLLAKLKNLRATAVALDASKKLSREIKYNGDKIIATTAVLGILGGTLAASAAVEKILPEPDVSNDTLYSYSDTELPINTSGIDKDAILNNDGSLATEEETFTLQDIETLSQKHNVDPKFVEDLYNSGLDYNQIEEQLLDINSTIEQSYKTR